MKYYHVLYYVILSGIPKTWGTIQSTCNACNLAKQIKQVSLQVQIRNLSFHNYVQVANPLSLFQMKDDHIKGIYSSLDFHTALTKIQDTLTFFYQLHQVNLLRLKYTALKI